MLGGSCAEMVMAKAVEQTEQTAPAVEGKKDVR